MSRVRFSFVLCTLLLASCSSLPAFGPSADDIQASSMPTFVVSDSLLPYQLIDVSGNIMPVLKQESRQFPNNFIKQQFLTSDEVIGPSDELIIKFWEMSREGLFSYNDNDDSAFTLTVSNSGDINPPYVGNIHVSGLTKKQIRKKLLAMYRGKAIDPEVNIHVKKVVGRGVSVLGDVKRPGRVDIPANGLRLLDVMAMTGGVIGPTWENVLTIKRKNISFPIRYDYVLDRDINNVVLLPGDVVQVERTPRKFSVYGAVSKTGNFAVNKPVVKLSDLLATSGGLNDNLAEARSVFIFRENKYTKENSPTKVYRLNFERPDAFILASKFMLSEGDIVFVATADASEFNKFIRTFISPSLSLSSQVKKLGAW
ncbi:polysaccharide biosynthesis/export family protein [Polycladidibacter stylochi]|uniref:polysaccharide biosynthesis/export family protein n=1 Tax=Polycladidibacter stylochi TaxID=1807766 RepID=UPI000836C9E0|nr:polysaccharide biosynthesis/export family protein [Pseudovibrio stylochi]